MSRPQKLSNRTKRRIRAQLTYERKYQDTHNRRVKKKSLPLYAIVPEKKDSVFELISGGVLILLLPVIFGMAIIIFGV